jgi:hypothetical protein
MSTSLETGLNSAILQIPLGSNAPPPHVTVGQSVMQELGGAARNLIETFGSSGQHDALLDTLRSSIQPTTKIQLVTGKWACSHSVENSAESLSCD